MRRIVASPEIDSSIRIPIRPGKKLPVPAVSAALGMAVSYYSYPFLITAGPGRYFLLSLFFLLVAIVGFLRTLNSFPGNKRAALKKTGILAVAAAAGFSLGIAARRSVSGSAEMGLGIERVIAVSGVLREDPRSLQGGSGMGILELTGCTAQGGIRASARGNITVFFPSESIPRLKEFGRGCEIYIDGSFANSVNAGREPLFRASSLHVVKPAPALETFRTSLRNGLLERFQNRQGRKYLSGSPPVWGSLASALLLGVRDDLDVALSEGFRNSGCSHVLALSGMHLAILSGVLAFLLRRPLGIRWASLLGAVFIVFYVFVAGSQPSLVRAAIMYLIGTIALWGFLKGKPLSLLCMAFIIQLLFQGGTGISLSFILSYLALFGILTVGESLRALSRGRLPEFLGGGLCASIGAFVLTAPVVAFYFGSLRPIGILAGLIVAPLSSVFMILALAALAASFLPFPLWDALDFILTWLYRLLETLVSLMGGVPGLTFSNPLYVLIFSILFWFGILLLQKRDSLQRNSIASFN